LYGGDHVRLRDDASRWPLPGHITDQLTADPLSWFERERGTLISGVRQAAQAGMTELCWALALGAVTLYESRLYLDDWQETHQVALDAVQRARDTRGEAAVLYSMGTLSMVEQRFGAAYESLSAAAALFREIDDDQGLALVVRHVAFLDRLSGRLEEAASGYEQALRVFRAAGDPIAAAYVLHGLAGVKLEQGALGQAQELLGEALRLSQGTRSARVEAQVLHRMGEAHLRAGEPGRAAESFGHALERVRDAGDSLGEAYALHGVGVARVREGKPDLARAALQRAMVLARTVGDRLVEGRVLLGMAELALVSGDTAEAAALAEQAAGAFSATGASLYEKQAHALVRGARAEPPADGADPGRRDSPGLPRAAAGRGTRPAARIRSSASCRQSSAPRGVIVWRATRAGRVAHVGRGAEWYRRR
jgi:tetratricopeptide (TPR) repeat protein